MKGHRDLHGYFSTIILSQLSKYNFTPTQLIPDKKQLLRLQKHLGQF